MFGKSKFLTKGKSSLKLTKNRVEGIKRKRNSMEKYLRNDISDLLRNGFHLNAFGRAEGLQVEMNKSACYEFVDRFCGIILEHLSVMNKQKECPEQCQEAVPSLMFAAARFADLPELRELRTVFADKYGNSLDTHINKEFVEKLEANPPTKDMKLQLLQEIAKEYELEWDPRAMEKQLNKPLVDEKEIETKKSRSKPVKPVLENEKLNLVKPYIPKINKNLEKEVSDDDKCKPRGGEIKNIPIDGTDEEKAVEKKPIGYSLLPPPYTKPKATHSKTNSLENHHSLDESGEDEDKEKPKSVRRKQLRPPPGKEKSVGGIENNGYGKGKGKEELGVKMVLEERRGNHSRTVSLPPEEISPSETKKRACSKVVVAN